MEEKNSIVISYINNKVKLLEEMSLYIPKENIDKLMLAFLNCSDDINAIKIKIDTIFNNSVAAYKRSIEKIGVSYQELIDAYEKIVKLNKTKINLYFSGGIIPYLLLNEESTRRHINLDLLCDINDARMIREIFRKKDLYEPKRDSLTYIEDVSSKKDYGFEVIIDDVTVNISTFKVEDDKIFEYRFDYVNKIGLTKEIEAKFSDYITPYVSSDNKKYFTLSLEFLIASKLLLKRDKDLIDIEKIKECNGISEEKIRRIPIPKITKERLVGDNLEFTSTMPRIKLEVPKRTSSNGFINIASIIVIISILAFIILASIAK